MEKKIESVAVVGAGAIGIYYGARLHAAGLDVRFLLRSDFDHVARHGLRVESVAGDLLIEDPVIYKQGQERGTVDLVLVALKTTANEHLGELLAPLVGEDGRVLTLQNGLGNTEWLAAQLGGHRVYGGLCFVCINRVGEGYVRHTAAGLIRLGAYQFDGSAEKREELEEVVSVFKRAEIPCEGVDDLVRAQWMKLVWNIPFNGLSIAMGGVDTEVILSASGMENRVMKLMREVQAVAMALGCVIENAFLVHQIERTGPMGAYRPSSMIDFVEGREVEVDAIWREPLRISKEHEVEVPELERLVAEIDAQLKSRASDLQ